MLRYLLRSSFSLAFLVLLLTPRAASAQDILYCVPVPMGATLAMTADFQAALESGSGQVVLNGACNFDAVSPEQDVGISLIDGATWTWTGNNTPSANAFGHALVSPGHDVQIVCETGTEVVNGRISVNGGDLDIRGCIIDGTGYASAITIRGGSPQC